MRSAPVAAALRFQPKPGDQMTKVTFLQFQKELEGREGSTVLDVALESQIPLQHACGGFCACTTCEVHLVSGEEYVSLMQDDERDRLEKVGKLTPGNRLGCQMQFKGSGAVTLKIINVE